MNELTAPVGYTDFLHEVKAHIRQRQYQALRAANHELLALYWWMGEAIQRRQTEHGWGKAVVETLARDLQAEFPGRNGFSARNLWNMLDFYTEYSTKPKLQPLVAEISWAKNLLIMARCKDDLERHNCRPTLPGNCPAQRPLPPVCRPGVTAWAKPICRRQSAKKPALNPALELLQCPP